MLLLVIVLAVLAVVVLGLLAVAVGRGGSRGRRTTSDVGYVDAGGTTYTGSDEDRRHDGDSGWTDGSSSDNSGGWDGGGDSSGGGDGGGGGGGD